MLSFVVTKVTNDFASRIGFYLRARIGLEIIYLSSVFVGHGGNRTQLRCKRVLLLGRGRIG